MLSTRTFLVEEYLTIADVLMFYFLHRGMVSQPMFQSFCDNFIVAAIFKENLSYLDKEKLIHLSRWFDNLQQMDDLRQHLNMVDFKTNYLSFVAPARH